jgi:hypothetical protein
MLTGVPSSEGLVPCPRKLGKDPMPLNRTAPMIAMSQYMFHILISNVKILILALSIPAFVFCIFISIEMFTNRAGLPLQTEVDI